MNTFAQKSSYDKIYSISKNSGGKMYYLVIDRDRRECRISSVSLANFLGPNETEEHSSNFLYLYKKAMVRGKVLLTPEVARRTFYLRKGFHEKWNIPF